MNFISAEVHLNDEFNICQFSFKFLPKLYFAGGGVLFHHCLIIFFFFHISMFMFTDVMWKWLESSLILLNWYVEPARMFPEHKCVPNMEPTFLNTSAVIVVLLLSSFVSVPLTFAMLVMMIFNA